MSEEKPKSVPSRRRFRNVWIPVILGTLLLLWLLHAAFLSWVFTRGLETWSSTNHLIFSAEKISVRLDGPVSLQGLKFRSTPGSGLATTVEIALVEWHWMGFSSIFSDSEKFIRDLQIKGLSGIWDLSSGGPEGEFPLRLPLPRCLPRDISVDIPSLEILGKSEKWQIRDLAVKLSENSAGTMDASAFALHLDGYSKSLGPLHARTAWKNGTLWLADMELAPGITAENLSFDFLHSGGPAISLSASCFGGSLRSDLTIQSSGGMVDMASWASNIPLDRMASLLAIPGEIGGKLNEGRFTFRGRPDRPADAEASLRLVADGFQWNKRGWELLEVGASLIHRRLVVTGFDLRQKENRVNFSGEISLAEGWSQISKSPFLVNFRADIHELGTLAGLLGGPLNEAGGRMTASGSVSGRPGELDGFLSLEASGMEFRSLPPSSLRLEAVFRKNEIDVAVCDLFSRKDTASLHGTVGIPAPHQYAAEIDARIADLAVYLAPFHAPGAEQIYAGALDVKWQGDGNWKSHSGAFDLKLRDFVSGATPAGLTGKFAGTYSPQNLYFSRLEAENGPLRLGTQATIASSGITLKDVELKTNNTPLLEGAAFVPLDVFAVIGGKAWRAAIDPDREAYIRLVTPKDLSLRSLLDLAGQQAPLEGQLRMNVEAGGPPSSLSAKGDLTVRDLLWKLPGSPVPPSLLTMKFSAGNGTASVNGLLETKKFPPVTLEAHMPFGLIRNASGEWQWANPGGAFDARLDFPKTELAVFRSFLPKLQRLTGSVSGRLALSGTIGEPRTDGRMELKDGGFEFSPSTPAVKQTEAVLAFDGTHMRIEHFQGCLGTGTFQISGNVGLSTFSNPAWDLQIHGGKIPVVRNADVRLNANVDATLKGDNTAGTVQGSLRFVDSRIAKRLAITPVLLDAPEEATQAMFLPPFAPGSVPDPFSRWTLNLKIENETPLLIPGKITPGEIIPKITLQGTLDQPVPVGRITLNDVQVFLPSATLDIPEGRLDFLPDAPWIPFLDVRGKAQMPDIVVQAYAFGPLNEKKLILQSDPPVAREALILLLSTRITSEGKSYRIRPGEASAGQGGLFSQGPYETRSDLAGADSAPLMNVLQTQSIPLSSLSALTTLRGSVRLFENDDPGKERDGYGYFNAGASYLLNLR